jgi:hypothetical protein
VPTFKRRAGLVIPILIFKKHNEAEGGGTAVTVGKKQTIPFWRR